MYTTGWVNWALENKNRTILGVIISNMLYLCKMIVSKWHKWPHLSWNRSVVDSLVGGVICFQMYICWSRLCTYTLQWRYILVWKSVSHTHTYTPTKYMSFCPGIQTEKSSATLGVLEWLEEWGSGMFSRFCFGVRLSGDRAFINFNRASGIFKARKSHTIYQS